MHGQDKRRPSRHPRRLAPAFCKEGRHGTQPGRKLERHRGHLHSRRDRLTRASDGLARAVHTDHDRPHVPVQAAAARHCFEKVGAVSRHVEKPKDHGHVARHHASFTEGPPGAMARRLVAFRR